MILDVDNERTSSTCSAGTAFPCAGSQKFAIGIRLPASWTCNCGGPYRLWEHTQSFQAVDGGTHMSDVVRYALPFVLLGAWLALGS